MKQFQYIIMLTVLCVLAAVFLAACSSVEEEPGSSDEINWSGFRGSSGGVVTDAVLPVTWNTTENVLWKIDIIGRAWSGPIVWGDKIFITTVASEGEVTEAKKGLYFGGNRDTAPGDIHHWIAACYDFKNGKQLWSRTVHSGKPAEPVHIKNTYASETPVTDGEYVYFYFGNLGLFCFDLSGNEMWSKHFDPVKMRYNWGTAASPVLHGKQLFIVNDNEDESYLLSLDKKTGSVNWRIVRDEKSNWATPYIWKNEKRIELVTCGTKKVRSYDLHGKLLWELGPMSSIDIPTPVEDNGLLYLCSGYVGDRENRPVYAVRPGASGDISPANEKEQSPFIAWYHQLGGPYNPSPIAYEGYFYILHDRGSVTCYDGVTGEIIYDKQQLARDARAFTVSPWANDGKLYFLSEDGDTFVVSAGEEFNLIGRNPLEEMCMAAPAALRGNLLIRTLSKLYRIGS